MADILRIYFSVIYNSLCLHLPGDGDLSLKPVGEFMFTDDL